ncbi:Fis family transcriptional regulator [Cupriavidus sp. HPC(L)]|uniref:sigma-54-dependent transcriptional regulator n=1 Tax=Cupriavidus sp. HPC(L) TaxID=1217418 RepID=UPI000291ADA9|nr:Fis family transcriptional regulator [Cupriavidus sp. HPC(L)]
MPMRTDLSVLYVEDDAAVRLGSTQSLQIAGLSVEAFGSAEQVLHRLTPGFAGVLVTDVRLPGINGLALLDKALEIDAALPVILVTGHGDISMAVQAMRRGAYDFVEKPYSPGELTEVVQRAMEKRALTLEVEALRRQLADTQAIEAKVIGRSAAVERLRKLILDLACTDADVLILGETGTGKELVARCLHEYGPRRQGNFAALNCGGVPESLFESEVFGHESGAFTGAARRRVGKIEYAQRGSLFLDEIETMPMSLQIKLLRTLQERQFERLGSNTLLPMDCRVIAATKVDLLALSAEQRFRADLYYRLNVAVIDIPPLRERREDIPLLFSHFLLQAALRYERPVPEVSPPHMRELMMYPWPGNVRELRNAADRFVLGLPGGSTGMPGSHGSGNGGGNGNGNANGNGGDTRSLDEQVAVFERHLIEEALRAASGRTAAASDLLRVPKKTLYDKIKRLGVNLEAFRANAGTD